jgi:phospholipase/carboxylesterase
VKKFFGLAAAFLCAYSFFLTSLWAQPEEQDSLSFFWHRAFFAEIHGDNAGAIAAFHRVHDLCETESLDISEWYRGASWFGIARAEANLHNIVGAKHAIARTLANHFWNFELLRTMNVFDTLCGSQWMDSVIAFWKDVRENDKAFWHPQPSIILRPATLEPGKKYPLVIVLHGGNDNYLRIIRKFSLLPDKLNVVLVVPAAVHRMSDVINSWDDDTANGEARISGLITEMAKNNYIDSNNVSLVGFSQGSQMSYEFSCDHPEKIRNVFAFAGFAPARDPIAKIRKAAGHHVRFVAISGSTDAESFLTSTRDMQTEARRHGIPFAVKIEENLPHGLPLDLTSYFSQLWNDAEESTHSVPSAQTSTSRSR